jgi:broad specificity phosphatase PhoE
MQKIYLIRHGETDFNRDGRVQGVTESTLSDLGKEQARLIGKRIRTLGIEAAVCSPLGRAVDTCRIAFNGSMDFVTYKDLHEIHLGDWEGRTAAELKLNYPAEVELWYRKPSELRIPGGETIRRFRNRISREMDRMRADFGDVTIAVFIHGGVICAYLTRLLGMKLDDIWRFKIRNGSMTRVAFPDGRPRIDLLGDVHHLDGAQREVPASSPRMFP